MTAGVWTGVGVSPGTAVGPVGRVQGPAAPPAVTGRVDVPAETGRAEAALDAVGDEIDHLSARAGAGGAVLVRQARIARDPALVAVVRRLVRSGRGAARAVWEAFEAYGDMRASDPTRTPPARAELDDVRDRVVARLLGEPAPALPVMDAPYVLVARDLSPALTATLDPAAVLAIVTERGGPTSHTAVLAKALGIPAVVGLSAAASLTSGQKVSVDGSTGQVRTDALGSGRGPARTTRQSGHATGPGATRDGRPVLLLAAVGGSPAEVAAAVEVGAEGVGVFRTEFAFLGRPEPPGVAEQEAGYRAVLDAFAGKPVVVRTLDVGADKPADFLRLGDQPNPALGVRGIRVARRHPDLLADQLTAIARAASGSAALVSVMAPMVATVGEAAWFASLATTHGIAVTGVMVEVPAAALRAAELLEIVDFVSVGSNDLASYTFATDREDAELTDLLDPWQPAFLSLVGAVLTAGTTAGRPVTVCGEAPGDPDLAPVLVGLGAAGLSMTPRAIPAVREALANVTSEQCEAMARAALAARTPEEARETVAAIRRSR